jgi:aminomethyltransferase
MENRNTALSHVHKALGAKMVPFAGYNMPVQYEGVSIEHINVREHVGVFDVSHMGEFIIRGEGAFELVQKVTSNDVSKLVDGKVQYSCLPNGKGGIVDDLLVYRMDEKTYLLVVNASNINKDWDWISMHNTDDVVMENISDKTSLLAVQGPKAALALESLTDMNISDMKYYTFQKGTFAGKENVLISTTGYTGAGGFEIYFKNEDAEAIWNAVFESGKEYNILPVGLAARDTLRLEMGFCLYGNDIDDSTSPLEAGLGWITKFTNNFVDSDFLKKQKEIGIKRRLVGFELVDRGVPRHGYDVLNGQGEKIGVVTSGTMSPSLKKAIGLAYVPVDMKVEGTEIYISVRKKQLKAKVVSLPFYKG